MIAMLRRTPLGLTSLIFAATFLVVLPTATAAPDAGNTESTVRQADWGSCRQWLGDTGDIPTARCATVTVPVDYSKPDGAQAQLAVIKIPATGQRIGSLIINPGGPGESAVDVVAGMAASFADNEITRHFDLVGFDPRGVGHSTPEVRCRTDAEFDAFRREPLVDYSPAGVAHIEDLYRQYAAECLNKVGAQFLANVGTVNVARDMDVIRQALGDAQINYLGYSYGTQLGTAYAQAFPQNIRAMVLDGAVDPKLDAVEKDVRQMASFQQAFTDFAQQCATAPDCALGTDPSKANDRYHALVNPLVAKPGPTLDPRGLSYQDAITGTANSLHKSAGRVRRGPLRRLRDAHRFGRMGGRGQADPGGGAVHELRRVHRVRTARRVRLLAGATDNGGLRGHLAWPEQGGCRVHHARSRDAVSGRDRPGPSAGCVAHLVRWDSAHRGFQG